MTPGPAGPKFGRAEFVWDSGRQRLIWANRDGLAFWGEDTVTDLVERVFAPDDETARALSTRQAELEEGAAEGGGLSLTPLGEPVWAETECRLEPMADGRPGLRVALGEVARPGDALLARMRAAFDGAPRALAQFSAAGEALARNQADRRAFPPERAALTARFAAADAAEAAIAAALNEGGCSHTAALITATGERRHRITLRRMRDPVGGALTVVGDFVDLSDRPSTPEGPQVSLDALASLAHDFRSPLTAIQGFAEFMQSSGAALGPEKQAEYLQNIVIAGKRMMRLADRMVALGDVRRAERAQIERVDVARLAAEAARLSALRAADLGVDLRVVAKQPMVEVAADPEATERIIDNLITNALAHGVPKGGAVTISVQAAAGDAPASIEVADDGAGLSAEALVQALQPYGHSGAGRIGGIGLSTSMKLAETMAAKLEFESAPGEGFAARLVFAV